MAADLLNGNASFANHYTAEEKARFEQYLAGQLAKINDVPNPDTAYLREMMLKMYANPLFNQLEAQA